MRPDQVMGHSVGQDSILWTIGHSNHTAERLIELLEGHGISVVADVRTSPYSAYSAQFNREQLQRILEARAIRYVFLGAELGGRPADDAMFDQDGRVRYDLVAATELFLSGIERLWHGIGEYQVAVLCGEEDPISCHRRRLVGRVMASHGVAVRHIRRDCSFTTEADLVAREQVEFPERFQLTLDGRAPWRSEHPVKRQADGGDE